MTVNDFHDDDILNGDITSNIKDVDSMVDSIIEDSNLSIENIDQSYTEVKKRGRKKKNIQSDQMPNVNDNDSNENSLNNDDNIIVKQNEIDIEQISSDFSKFLSVQAGKYVSIVSDDNIQVLPTGILLLDHILGGGFGLGTFSLIIGLPGTFKSSLVSQVIAFNQKRYNGKFLSVYLDSESAMTRQRLKQLGVTNPELTPFNNVTVEGVFKTIEAMCIYKKENNIIDIPSVIIWDSIANTITDYEKKNDIVNSSLSLGLKARLLSLLLPKYVTKLREYNISLIAVNQLRDAIHMGPYNASPRDIRWIGEKNIPGGNSLKFNAFHIVFLKIRSDLDSDKWGDNGVVLEAKCVKNKLFSPNISVPLIVTFKQGISNILSNYYFAQENKIIEGTSWKSLKSYPNMKWQNVEVFLEYYNTNSEFKKSFDNDLLTYINNMLI